ncbi:MAG: Nif11-like leader peptide family RiPP precursor [Synergistaceae bacterium]|jgi:predicted ribosomally synthesized peptide with nif11-like leader|nr:Nif11-like leader peptide family RiPP precursor [Synergistaceae bacterium]
MAKGFKEFKERVMSDKSFEEKIKSLKSVEEAVELGRAEGYSFTVDDVKNNSELTEAELTAVAGGISWVLTKAYLITR